MRHTQIRKHARSNGHDLATNWVRIKGAVTEAIDNVKDSTGGMIVHSVGGIKKKSVKAQSKIATYTAKKPFKSLGIAMLTGAVLGLIFLRRR
jgi:ElaB/YqjD/DUF883 family membrane-anchored ribosome-binding protein